MHARPYACSCQKVSNAKPTPVNRTDLNIVQQEQLLSHRIGPKENLLGPSDLQAAKALAQLALPEAMHYVSEASN